MSDFPQAVKVEVMLVNSVRTLTYLWNGPERLEVGDLVEKPPNWYKKQPEIVHVCEVDVEPDFTGEIQFLTRKVEKPKGELPF